MSLLNLLDNKCDIYHLNNKSVNVGYSLPEHQTFNYDDVANEKSIKCHFSKDSNYNTIKGEPFNSIKISIELILPINTDIRLNDKIVDLETNEKYTAGVPKKIRNSHVVVKIRQINNRTSYTG